MGAIKNFLKRNCSILISLAISSCIISLYFGFSICIFESKNVSKIFELTVTFVSILLGFLGVLLSVVLSSIKEKNIIQYFFKTVDRKAFQSKLLGNVVLGIVLIIVSLLLIVHDKFDVLVLDILWVIWIFLLILFSGMEISFYHLFLKMLIYSADIDESYNQIEHENIDDLFQ